MNRYRIKKNIKRLLFVLLVLLIIVVLMFPVTAMISMFLKKVNDVLIMPVTWILKIFAFEDYVQVFEKMRTLNDFEASLIITGLTISLIMVIVISASYAFSCLDFYLKKQVYYLALVSRMFAPVIVIIPLYTMMNRLELIDSWFSLVFMNTTFNLTFIVLMLKATFDGVPKEVVEAARIDGCSSFMVMIGISLPISSTGIVVVVIFAFTRAWSEFLFAFTFISTTEKKPIIVSLYEILKNSPAVGILWHYVMAGAMYTTVPLAILSICTCNYITRDHTAGAIK